MPLQTHALADVCFTKGYWTVDEMRRGIEGLPPAAYRYQCRGKMDNAILLCDFMLLMPMHKLERGLCVWCRELTYYEKWARSLAVILKERGTITQSELDATLGHDVEKAPAIKYACAPSLLHLSYPSPQIGPKQHICQTR